MPTKPVNYQKYYSRYKKYYSERIDPFIKSKHGSAYSMIILSLFTVAFFGMFAIRPTLKTIVELKRQIEDSKEIDAALQKKIDSLVSAQEEYQLVKNFVPAIAEALPQQPNITQILQKIETMASDSQATISGLQVQKVNFQTDSQNTDATSILKATQTPIDISLRVSGTYDQVNDFLNKLFKTRRTVTAQSLDLLPEGTDQLSLKLLLKLNTYYLK